MRSRLVGQRAAGGRSGQSSRHREGGVRDARPAQLLASFLSERSRLTFTAAATPAVSVVVVVWNHADLTLTCLRALAEQTDVATGGHHRRQRVHGRNVRPSGALAAASTIIRNSSNLGFTMALNVGAKAARGEFLLFLNNDAALDAREHRASVGDRAPLALHRRGRRETGVSGRPSSGSRDPIIWSDGSCDGYGRGGDPSAPEYNFERPVDFCSAALLLTPRALFEQLGGFDERYRPAYYDDADYCVRVWTTGPLGRVSAESHRHSLRVRQHLAGGQHGAAARAPADLRLTAMRRWLAAQSVRRRQRAGGAIAPARPAFRPRHRRCRSGSTDGRGIPSRRRAAAIRLSSSDTRSRSTSPTRVSEPSRSARRLSSR